MHVLPGRSSHVVLTFLLLLAFSIRASSQQPFLTDDTDVTPKHHFHFEFSNELDSLQRSSFPGIRQNTADFELDYGLLSGVEIGIEAPVITIDNAPGITPGTASGLGDINLSLKYNLLAEPEHSRLPAVALALNLELPTGDLKRQLGSGLSDFYINGILQKTLTSRTRLRLNGGILFSGNETTGLIGIKTRGTVFTGGASLVRQFTSRLDLGLEITGAETRNFDLGKGQLQVLVGGNYAIRRNITFDFGAVAGKYTASPRVGVQVGVSLDW
jgi:hypothetical protein